MASNEGAITDDYGAGEIQVLEGLEAVRKRPGMYVGGPGEQGLHHLVSEVVDNSIDEALAGHCDKIIVTLRDDGGISVEDNGRGIPVDIHEKSGRPGVEVVMTVLHAGGKFEKGSYQVSSGLHGVGVSCVNALSQWLEVEVSRDGKIYRQRYERGVPAYDLKVVGKTKVNGTKVTFTPDPKIFLESTQFKWELISKRLRELAFLNPGLTIVVRQIGANEQEEIYDYKDGIKEMVSYLNAGEDELLKEPIYITGAQESAPSGGMVNIEVAVQYSKGYGNDVRGYVNNVHTIDGGTHLTGFRAAWTSSFNNYVARKGNETKPGKTKRGSKKKSSKLPSGDAYREGMVCVISIKIPDPQFAGQTKDKLGNPDIKGLVTSMVSEALSTWIEEHPREAVAVVQKAQEAQRVAEASRKARDLARKSNTLKAPKKLADCTSKDPSESEIFMVEGDSAGGSARQGRNAHTQAILPLRGKILNVWKASPDKMLGHEEIKSIISALGTGILEDFEPDNCRYHKIIIMCDADVDGSHIRTLLLTFFFRQMPQLIEKGYVYIACPPLYGVKVKGRKGKQKYILDEEAFAKRMHRQGLEGTALVEASTDRRLEGKELVKLIKLIKRMSEQERRLGRRGFTLEEYIGHRNDQDEMLFARISMSVGGQEEIIDCWSEEQLDQVVEQLRSVKDGLTVWDDRRDSLLDHAKADIQVSVFTNKMTVSELVAELHEEFGFNMAQYFGEGGVGSSDAELLDEDFDIVRASARLSPFRLINEELDKDYDIDAIADVPKTVVDLAKSSISVKRYKGLGEMNADELWDTTMDPSHRKLFKVELADYAEARRSFACLMGSNVAPRRRFIETHALDVSDVDA